MPSDLYEILEIRKDATPEQIRKAYKRRALQTHPDRAPAEEKTQAEERFRQVNNAYEVLNDPEKRESYNRHGVWPPPTEEPLHYPQNDTRGHPFQPSVFAFTDPFELFESFFSPFHDPFAFGHPPTFHDPFFTPAPFPFPPPSPFRPLDSGLGMGGNLFQGPFPHDPFMPPMMGGGLFHTQGIGNRGPHFSSASSYSTNMGAGGGHWVSESRSISTINGLTTSVLERIDPSGNVHTTTTHPDGNQTYMINGIPQGSGQIDAPLPPYSNPIDHPRRPHHHPHPRHHGRSGGRHERHGTHRDRDYNRLFP